MKRRNYAVAAAAALLILASIAFGRIVGDRSDAKEEMIFRVERGSLEVKISEVGTLIAPRSVTIASEIQSNRAKVVRLTPEGTWVNPGDLLVEFDPTPFEEDVNKFSRVVKEAEPRRSRESRTPSWRKPRRSRPSPMPPSGFGSRSSNFARSRQKAANRSARKKPGPASNRPVHSSTKSPSPTPTRRPSSARGS